jgi:N-methylhydantoinase B
MEKHHYYRKGVKRMTSHHPTAAAELDAVLFQVIKASLSGIVQEMQNSLFRTGFSTIIRESQDASCAIMNVRGDVVAQHVVLPLHIGAFPACCASVLSSYGSSIGEGDAFMINHPYEGGSPHAPDMAVITPIFVNGDLVGFCGSIAHKSDIGGPVPGSCSGQAKEVFNEGLQLPSVRYQRGYETNVEVEKIISANSRTPELVLGDIRGQLGADRLGESRLQDLMEKYGKEVVLSCFDQLMDVAERRVRHAIGQWEDGVFTAERFVDDDGIELNKPVRICVTVEKRGETLRLDFTQSADQTKGPANIRPPLVQAACAYCLISMIDPHMYVCSGLLRSFEIVVRDGSVLNPYFPAPVNTYNPTVHAVVDAVFDALSGIVPDKVRADGCGSRSIVIGGRSTHTGKGYVQYEIVGGGTGARATKDGMSGSMVNQSNARIAPVEIIESEFPTRILRMELIRDSGGAGRFRGGLGICREYMNLQDARFSLRSAKHVIPPNGMHGGLPGRTGALIINPGTEQEERLPTRYADYPLKAGDIFRFETPGGGGYGDALTRNPQSVLHDVAESYISLGQAESVYGVMLEKVNGVHRINEKKTVKKRKEMVESNGKNAVAKG